MSYYKLNLTLLSLIEFKILSIKKLMKSIIKFFFLNILESTSTLMSLDKIVFKISKVIDMLKLKMSYDYEIFRQNVALVVELVPLYYIIRNSYFCSLSISS